MTMVGSAGAAEEELHAALGKRPPREVLNREISALSAQERSVWIHGALSQMVQVFASLEPETAQCLSAWAFDRGDGLEAISAFFTAYPEQLATVTISAVALQACPRS